MRCQAGTPLMVVNGSGKAANVLAYVIMHDLMRSQSLV
jgi:hypothetical protein